MCDARSRALCPAFGTLRDGGRTEWLVPVGVKQLRRAFDFSSKALDATFHDEHSAFCAIAIVRRTQEVLLLHNTAVVARAQLPDRLNFHGWIAIDPRASIYLEDGEVVAIWIHEIGHLLGLRRDPSPTSLMCYPRRRRIKQTAIRLISGRLLPRRHCGEFP